MTGVQTCALPILEEVLIDIKNVKNGDIILIKTDKINNNKISKLAENIRKELDKYNFKENIVFIVNKNVNIELLDEKIMFKLGWLKKKTVEKLLDEKINDN